MKKSSIFFLSILSLLLTVPIPATAGVMTNENYSIQKRSVEIESYQLVTITPSPPPAQTDKYITQNPNYSVLTTLPSAFSFATSLNLIDFGKLSATNPVVRQITFTLTSPTGYQILASQDHALQKGSSIIPDTTCDNGSCSEKTASLWNNTLTYGFGYHLEDMETDYYSQFADISKHELPTQIGSGTQSTNHSIKLTTKLNISRTQEAGSYINSLIFIATPYF